MKKFENINLNKELSEHLYVQLYNSIKKKIIDGDLFPDEKLPPIRKLADLLDVTNNTVVRAYKLLEDDNLVYKKVGSGTFVSQISFDEDLVDKGYVTYNENLINFASGTPSEDLFPVDEFKKSINYVLDEDKGYAFGYKNSKGDLTLRKLIKEKLIGNKIGITEDEIQIISGAQQGIDIVAKAILNPYDTVLLEAPTYTGAIAIFKSRGCNLVDFEINDGDVDFEKLEKTIQENEPTVFFTMPNLQNPTGFSYNIDQKRKILNLAEKYDFWIIEDDYSSELNFSKNNLKTLKELDENDRVIYIKSFSKIFLPGLRLGYLISPMEIKDEITMAKHTTDISTSSLIQKSFEIFLREGYWEKQVNTMRTIIKNKYLLTKNILEKELPKELSFLDTLGGVNFWIKFDENIDDKELYEYLLEKDILVAPGRTFFINKRNTNFIRISIASIMEENLEESLIKLCQNLKSFLYKDNEDKKRIPIL